MNPEIAKHWENALESFEDAKVAFKKGGPDHEIKGMLWMSVFHGMSMTKQLETGGEESLIAAGIGLENLRQVEQLDTRQAFDKVLQALRGYCNLVSDRYNLPLPTGLDK